MGVLTGFFVLEATTAERLAIDSRVLQYLNGRLEPGGSTGLASDFELRSTDVDTAGAAVLDLIESASGLGALGAGGLYCGTEIEVESGETVLCLGRDASSTFYETLATLDPPRASAILETEEFYFHDDSLVRPTDHNYIISHLISLRDFMRQHFLPGRRVLICTG